MKRIIFSNKNHFIAIAIILCTGLNNLNAQEGDPKLTEVWKPVPAIVTPGENGEAPSDALLLFDGKNLDEWTNVKGEKAAWKVENGTMTVAGGSGAIKSKQKFADFQLHIEWRTPSVVAGEGQGRGNSGILIQERYEVQVLDSYDNLTYSNGQAGSIYKQHIPLVNASKKPGEWQTYDIIFSAPRFNDDGSLKEAAYITVIHNGVLIQNHVKIKGGTRYIGQPEYEKHQLRESLLLQDHGNPVSFRNIWVRELNM